MFHIHIHSIRNALRKVKSPRFAAIIRLGGILLFTLSAFGAFELHQTDPRSSGLGGAGAALDGDGWAVSRNPALAARTWKGVGVSFAHLYGLPELARESLSASWSISGIRLGGRACGFGSDLYYEGEYALCAAVGSGRATTVGVELCGRTLDIRGYQTGSSLTATVGAAMQPADALQIGVVWRNANRPYISGYADRVEDQLAVGFALRRIEGTLLTADVVQERYFPAEYRLGVEAEVVPEFTMRIGMRAEPVRPSLGFHVQVSRWRFHYAGDLHPDLGASHIVGLDVRIGK